MVSDDKYTQSVTFDLHNWLYIFLLTGAVSSFDPSHLVCDPIKLELPSIKGDDMMWFHSVFNFSLADDRT